MLVQACQHVSLVVWFNGSRSILLAPDLTAKISDVGLAKLAGSSDKTLASDWASPEQHRGEPCSAKSDVYSYGVV